MFKFVLFLCLFTNLAQAKDFFIWNKDQTLEEYQTTIDLKTKEVIIPEKKVTAERFNQLNIINFYTGIQTDEFEATRGIFTRSLTPSAQIEWVRKFTLNLGIELSAQLSKNNIIPKQTFTWGTKYGAAHEFFLALQLGQKIALVSQETSGYFFLNYGLGVVSRWTPNYRTDLRAYLSNIEYNLWGYEVKVFKKVNKSELGLYFGLEQYNPFNIEYERQGQVSTRGGFVFSY